ncbi:MAG TPA: CHAD domain-containing protein [Acidobacteriaceae bacterium]|jgi:CHAD domain-containing protein|nr:CHAD domain-containing protein [Acidobacteriaceae bacterium]
MTHDLQTIQKLNAALRENLAKCAGDPDVDPVHDTRTGTRRLQATLENIVRELPGGADGEPVRAAANATMRLLKRVRHEAGPVRDLDVHRKLLEKLMKRAVQPESGKYGGGKKQGAEPPLIPDQPRILEKPEVGLRVTSVERQADDLDSWLKHRRREVAEELQSEANGLAAKFDRRMSELDGALRAKPKRKARKKAPGMIALESFARLATEMQLLDASNLHDFRKGAKKARYVAELAAQGDQEAEKIGATLKKLQDEIGDWHDWLVLADEAHLALGDQATELIGLLEAEREKHFVAAMKTAAKLRGRLMGEWQAVSRRPAQRATPFRSNGQRQSAGR